MEEILFSLKKNLYLNQSKSQIEQSFIQFIYSKLSQIFNKKMPSPSTLLFSIIPIVCLLFNSCFAAPHPCCPGSQHLVALMTNYIGTFSTGKDELTVCANAENAVKAIKSELNSMPKCQSTNGGGSGIMEAIDAELTTSEHMKMVITNEDVCAYNLGFVRAMFDMAKSAAGHVGKGAEWNKLTKDFGKQIDAINTLSTELTIFVPNVHFQDPKENYAHKKVPSPSDVRANPGKYSAANQMAAVELSEDDEDDF